jgi:hypothetical protein
MAKTTDRISDVKPYVERAMKDEDLRDNVMAAFAAAREVYNDLLGNRGVTGIASRVATDREIQENLKRTVDELREAADRLQGKKDHSGRNTMLLLTGITLGILFNPMTGPATRKWVKDKILGPSDDFTYGGDSSYGGGTFGTGTTTPSQSSTTETAATTETSPTT